MEKANKIFSKRKKNHSRPQIVSTIFQTYYPENIKIGQHKGKLANKLISDVKRNLICSKYQTWLFK